MRRLELQIERLSKSGDGVAHVGGRAVFVQGALPGEKVLAEVSELGKALKAEVLEVLVASPARRVPICPLATACGGCDWMHVDEPVQLEQKQEIVTSALEHLGQIERVEYALLPTVGSTKELHSRRRAVLHPAEGRLGFFGRHSHTRVVIDSCPALTEPLTDLPGVVADALGTALKDTEEVHLLEAAGRVTLSLHVRGALRPKHREALTALVRAKTVAGAVLVPGEGKGSLEQFGDPVVEEDGTLLRPDGFAQANAEVNRVLVRRAVELLEVEPSHAVLELYAGNGNFTFALAPRVRAVTAVESSSVAVWLAQEAARRRGVSNVRFIQGDAEKLAVGFQKGAERFDRLLLDPPRVGAAGIGRWAHQMLASRVVYVACDPASLARDARELVDVGFKPVALQLFDLFPQTRHIEAVMAFAR
jgi:23S rRNA (uracil1939-C5)-methyltransferase